MRIHIYIYIDPQLTHDPGCFGLGLAVIDHGWQRPLNLVVALNANKLDDCDYVLPSGELT